MENDYQKEIIKELIIKIMKIVAGVIVAYIFFCIVYGIIDEVKKGKNKEIKIKYTPSDITKKYPQDFIKAEEVMSEIKRSVNSSYTKTTGEDEITTYLDSRGLVVYKITQNLKIQISAQGGKGGYNVRKDPPKEEGYVYDRNGNMVNKIAGGLYSPHAKDPFKRASEFNWKKIFNSIEITTIGYDNFGNKIREEQLNLGNWYKKEITEYSNGKKTKEKKIIDYEVDAEEYNKIYVEITKEYDETEKLIKKFVLRKNKFNAVRSETNFDFIKGEIVTKYYDGEKDFATVTETLIGKDRAIVKRERVGDEFVIWDDYELDNNFNKYIYYKKKKELKFAFLNAKAEFEWQYNDSEVGIDKNSFNREHFYNEDMESNYSTQVSLSGDIYEFLNEDKTIKINKITYKENAKLPRKIMYKRFANEVTDPIFMEEIKNYVNRVDTTYKEFEIKNNLKKLLEEIK